MAHKKVYGIGENKCKIDLLDFIYPIGSIYESTVNTDPSQLFGGTWERIKGKVLVGVDEDDKDFQSAEKTGGEKTHTLTVSEIPDHYHYVPIIGENTVPGGTPGIKTGPFSYGNLSKNLKTTYSGTGDMAHNNLQPYATCYMWKRVA